MVDLDLKPLTLEQRVDAFKNDPEKIGPVNDFLDDLLDKARVEAETKRNGGKSKKFDLNFQNGSKRIGEWSNRARTSARAFASRVYTVICNCTTNAARRR